MKTLALTIWTWTSIIGGFACLTVSAKEVDITMSPYNATTSMTDVGPIINQAINDLRALGGGTVYIPTGNWTFTTPISIVNNSTLGTGSIVIRGDGAHHVAYPGGTDLIFEKRDGASDAITVNGSGGPNVPRVTIRDLCVDGGTSTQITAYINGTFSLGNHHGIVLENANNFEVSCVCVAGFAADNIFVENSSYGSVRDADIAYGGIGVDCLSSKSLQLDTIAVHGCTNAFRNPPQLIACTVEGNNGDGILLQQANSTYVSVHDTYFEGNNFSQAHEGADVASDYSSGSPSIALSMSGHCSWGSAPYPVPYRRVRGGFEAVVRTGSMYWTETLNSSSGNPYATWDVTNTIYLDAGVNPAAGSQEGWTVSTGNSYQWHYSSQTIPILP